MLNNVSFGNLKIAETRDTGSSMERFMKKDETRVGEAFGQLTDKVDARTGPKKDVFLRGYVDSDNPDYSYDYGFRLTDQKGNKDYGRVIINEKADVDTVVSKLATLGEQFEGRYGQKKSFFKKNPLLSPYEMLMNALNGSKTDKEAKTAIVDYLEKETGHRLSDDICEDKHAV